MTDSTPRFLAVGTHHKTGTVWMRRTFRKFVDDHGIPTVRMNGPEHISNLPEEGPALCVNWQSRFPAELWEHAEVRFLHMIRDPRDVLISGARYHLTAPLGNEKWLGRPRDQFGGKSYQEALNALPTRREQLLFEMAGKHAESLAEMLDWPYGHERAVDLRYEDMIFDEDCALFREALESMGVAGFDIDGLVGYYWRHSLFGGLAEKDGKTASVASHIRSGKVAQWRETLPREVAEIYADRHGEALIRLGYATDHSWVRDCRPEAEIAA